MTIQFIIRGRVQGVGFRFFVLRAARAAGLVGWVRNLPDGSVEALASGDAEALARLREALRRGPPAARVEAVEEFVKVTAEEDVDSKAEPPAARFEIR
jgi:acylphosphatase